MFNTKTSKIQIFTNPEVNIIDRVLGRWWVEQTRTSRIFTYLVCVEAYVFGPNRFYVSNKKEKQDYYDAPFNSYYYDIGEDSSTGKVFKLPLECSDDMGDFVLQEEENLSNLPIVVMEIEKDPKKGRYIATYFKKWDDLKREYLINILVSTLTTILVIGGLFLLRERL